MLPSELTKNSSKNLMKIYQEALQNKKKHKLFQHLPKSYFPRCSEALEKGAVDSKCYHIHAYILPQM